MREVPLIADESAVAIDSITRRLAEKVWTRVDGQVRKYAAEISRRYGEKHRFAILFSYLLDGLVWKEFERRNLIAPLALTSRRQKWNGEFWLIKTRRPFDFGTNTYNVGDYKISILWNEKVLPAVRRQYNTEFLDHTIGYLNSRNPKGDSILIRQKLVSPSGSLIVPVLREDKEDPFYSATRELSSLLVESFLADLPTDPLMTAFPFSSKSQAILVAYHEFMWNFLALLVQNRVAQIPEVYQRAAGDGQLDLSAGVFLRKY